IDAPHNSSANVKSYIASKVVDATIES
ncbi:hypothetical protein A2U01_0085091, partial [Trifolium medium]|nr:hypothetical protein [Trifolium medium]